MLSTFLTRERDQILSQLQPGRPHSDAFRRAVEVAFDLADTFEGERRSLSDRPAAERKAALAQIVDSRLLPRLAEVTAPVRAAKGPAEAKRLQQHGINLSADLSDLIEDIGRVELATYFVQREMQSASAMSTLDLHAMMSSEQA